MSTRLHSIRGVAKIFLHEANPAGPAVLLRPPTRLVRQRTSLSGCIQLRGSRSNASKACGKQTPETLFSARAPFWWVSLCLSLSLFVLRVAIVAIVVAAIALSLYHFVSLLLCMSFSRLRNCEHLLFSVSFGALMY